MIRPVLEFSEDRDILADRGAVVREEDVLGPEPEIRPCRGISGRESACGMQARSAGRTTGRRPAQSPTDCSCIRGGLQDPPYPEGPTFTGVGIGMPPGGHVFASNTNSRLPEKVLSVTVVKTR